MTTADVLTSPDALALLCAIDAGDDAALTALADLLEECGDGRAAGLRQRLYRLGAGRRTWWHYFADGPALRDADEVHTNVFDALFRRIVMRRGDRIVLRPIDRKDAAQSGIEYPSRSLALLALAEALAAG